MRRLERALAWSLPFALAANAHAHTVLDHAQPAAGSTISVAPHEVRIWFTERLEPAFSNIQIHDRSGTRIDRGGSRVDPRDARLLTIPLPKLDPGMYKVSWRVLSVDTHVSKGDFTFDVAP